MASQELAQAAVEEPTMNKDKHFEDIIEYGTRTLVIFEIQPNEIETLDLTRLLTTFDVKRIKEKGFLKKLFRSVLFVFDGYNSDPRAIHEIPEIRRYVRKLYEYFPYWFYVWEDAGHGLAEFCFCLLDNIDVARKDSTDAVSTCIDWRESKPILNALSNSAAKLAKGVLTKSEFDQRMKEIAHILQIPQQLVETPYRSD
jgi:hypothetical protein